MKQYPSISIAIPTLNEEENIARCLDSIFTQHYQGKIEVFLVDGGSADRTISIAKKYPVTIIHNPLKQAEYGKKIGLDHATGTYFMIFDCDMDMVGHTWLEKMVKPLEDNPDIAGSWTKFVSLPTDAPLQRFITLDPIQRDPLFTFLTPAMSACVIGKNSQYWIMKYGKNRMLPAGFNLYRRNELLMTQIKQNKKFMELDNIVILLDNKKDTYAYVQDIGIHHPFLPSLSVLWNKRIRNLETMYFDQPNRRYWTWIDWSNPFHLLKIILWIAYVYLLIPCASVGAMKCLRYQTWVGMYELPFNIVSTTAIIIAFARQFLRRVQRML